jgi:hypothetical protein
MAEKKVTCPDCGDDAIDRRDFLRTVGATAATLPLFAVPQASAAPTSSSAAETTVKALYDSLTDDQRKVMAFDWDYKDPKRGLLRTHVSNNWQITPQHIDSAFYSAKQKEMILEIFKGIVNPDFYTRFRKQLRDDTGGRDWGAAQSIALFGKPGSGQFEFVMTGRHLTVRADGDSTPNMAFGGPIFYGHAASGFNEKPGHPANVFWYQARLANFVYQILDGKQREKALVSDSPHESDVPFRGTKGGFPGIPVSEMTPDQRKEVEKVLLGLVEPFRREDQDEVRACLQKQGGLDKCSLAFYKDQDLGNDGEWDNWRLEGPSFVWYFRGFPHVHVWVNVADDPAVPLNAKG